jgi:hypothetical protein
MSDRHKVFISHHHALDQAYKDQFTRQFASIVVDWSVRIGDIADGLATETIRQKIRDEWRLDSTVTVVLVGRDTWQRKHVDWEIGSTLRNTQFNPRSGLLGILLPTNVRPPGRYDPGTVPPRLADNLTGVDPFAKLYSWSDSAYEVQRWIHEAFLRRDHAPWPNNGRDSFGRNWTGARWTD